MQKTSPVSGAQWVISSGPHEAVVVEVGGGLRDYRVAGQEIVDGYGEDEVCPDGAGHILAPWPNRIRDGRYPFGGRQYQLSLSEPDRHNAIHGLVCWVPWRPVEVGTDQVELECVLPASPGYPWTLRLTTTWMVGPEGLRASHTATNLSDQDCPFGLGAHPYLKVPGVAVDDVVVTVPADSRLLVDSRLLPIGAAKVSGSEYDFTTPRRMGSTRLDTAFGDVAPGGSEVVLAAPDADTAVRVWADEAFTWWQLFTGDSLPAPRTRQAIAVEPMTCPADAFHSGRDLVTLAPEQTWRGSWGITPQVGV